MNEHILAMIGRKSVQPIEFYRHHNKQYPEYLEQYEETREY